MNSQRDRNTYSYRQRQLATENIEISYQTETSRVTLGDSSRQTNSRSNLRKTMKAVNDKNVGNRTMLESMSEKIIGETIEQRFGSRSIISPSEADKENSQEVMKLLRSRCSNYEKTIYELYEKRDEQSKQLENSKAEIERLKSLYQAKLNEVSNVSNEITNRIQKQQSEKNLFIKEINNKNIEINKLRESYQVIKAQNDTLNIVIKEKESEIEQLQEKIRQVKTNQVRMEQYEVVMTDSTTIISQLEEKYKSIERQSVEKDQRIDELNEQIEGFLEKIHFYDEKVTLLEQGATTLMTQLEKTKSQLTDSQMQAEEWKLNYINVSRQLEQLPEIQIKLKNTLMTNHDLQVRIQELLQMQQKLKIQLNTQNAREKKITELQATLQNTQLQFKEKEETAQRLKDELDRCNLRLRQVNNSNQQLQQNEKQLEQRTKQYKALERKHEQRNIMLSNLERELKRITEENDKFKDRSEKIDQIFKENKRLTSTLMDKINEIQQLQHAINTFESRVATLSNEVLKLNALYQQSNDTVIELNSSVHTLQVRLDCQLNVKVQMQEKLEKMTSENTSTHKLLIKERENLKTLSLQKQTLRKQLEQIHKKQMEDSAQSQMSMALLQTQLLHEKSKNQELSCEIRQQKRKIEQQFRANREISELVTQLQADKRNMLSQYSSLRTNYEQTVSRNTQLEKWKTGYLSFMSSISRAATDMQRTSQQLMV